MLLMVMTLYSCHLESRSDDNVKSILISNCHVVQVESGALLPNQYVVIMGRLIKSVTAEKPSGQFDMEIEADGKFLMPGLINMYTHVNEDNLILYLANGQTTVKDAPSHLTALGLRERIRSGDLVGPRIFAVGLRATGLPAPYHSQQPARTEAEAREQVRESKRLGYDGMFIYGSCDPAIYWAIIEEASKLDFHISGHFPLHVNLDEALNKTQISFDNLTGLTRRGELLVNNDSLLQGMLEKGQAITPTLTVHRLWSLSDKNDSIYEAIPKEFIPHKMKASWSPGNGSGTYPYDKITDLIKSMYDKGIPIYIGSDGGYPMVVNGFSYHQELENLHEIGVPTDELLWIATKKSAEFLNYENLGLVKEGFLADLLLLDENPLEDIKNLQTISFVFVNGQPFSEEYLEGKLDELKRKIENPGDRFDPWTEVTSSWKEEDSIIHYSVIKHDVEVGEEKIRIDLRDKRNFTLESINIMDGPDMRETYTYVSVSDRKVDSLSIKSVTPEGAYIATISTNKTQANINGTAPFHGDFSYTASIYPGTLLLGPFTSRYFDLDIGINYVLAMLMSRPLSMGEADQLPVIQVELNSEEYGRKLIVDDSEYTIYRENESTYKIIHQGFSGYRTITRPSFVLDVQVNSTGIPVRIGEHETIFKLKSTKS